MIICQFFRLPLWILLLVLFFFLPQYPVFAQTAYNSNIQTALNYTLSTSLPQLTAPKELENFVDQFLTKQTDENITGAVFVLVKEGKIVFSKGYGYSDLEKKIPVSPNKTLFRIASLSKLFTTTAVMQLVEQGKLNLDRDINQYLDKFQIDNKYFPAITTNHLLTHTDGFDVAWGVGAANRCDSQQLTLEQFLLKNLPPRILPPGQVYIYGDAGIAVAGYLVEKIARVPFKQYIEQNIFRPLKMNNSSFIQPLPRNLAANLAISYYEKGGKLQPKTNICVHSIPTIGMSSTATDIAHFMIAQLQGGRYGNNQILQSQTVQQIHRKHFTNLPNLTSATGTAYGFYERYQNNQRAIEHGGNLYGHTSQLVLLPKHNLGLFLAYTYIKEDTGLREFIINKFFDRYYPIKGKENLDPLPKNQPSVEWQKHYREANGSYRFIRYPRHSIAKLGLVLQQFRRNFTVKANPNGTFILNPGGGKWVEVKPLLFRHDKSNTYIGFHQDSLGHITSMSFNNYIFATYQKLAWYETLTFQLGILASCSLVFLSTCLVGLVRFLIGRLCQHYYRASRSIKLFELVTIFISSCNLLFCVGMFAIVRKTDYWEFFFGLPKLMKILLYLPILTAGLTTVLSILTVFAGNDKTWSILKRSHHYLTLLAAWAFIFCLNYWNLL